LPEGYYREVPYPDRRELWLGQAAKDGRLIVCRCTRCQRTLRYLAADLLPILGPAHRASVDPPFPCGKCGQGDRIKISCIISSAGDYGALDVRRPAGIAQTQLWRTVELGDDVSNALRSLKDWSYIPARRTEPPDRAK